MTLNNYCYECQQTVSVFTILAGEDLVAALENDADVGVWRKCGIVGGHAHRFRDTFAVGLLEKGASLYDVAKLLGISAQTVEQHYSPYTKELQQRGSDLIMQLNFGD